MSPAGATQPVETTQQATAAATDPGNTHEWLHALRTAFLLATDDAVLQEGNRWGDRFWGVDLATGIGENQLGQVLMRKRRALREAAERSHTP